MLKNYLKTAWRNLRKNKFYTAINVAGLAAGLAIGILILLWVGDELGFDRFHKQADNIYRLENQVGTGSSIQIWSVTDGPIATRARMELPEVRDAVRISYNGFFTAYRYGDKIFSESKAYFADPSLFSVFDFPLIEGNPRNPFPTENSVVITRSTARRYFGDQDPMGKIILADNQTAFTVSGVIHDFPLNSSISGDLFFPMQMANKKMHTDRGDKMTIDEDWESFNYTTYLLLKPGTDPTRLAKKLRDIHLRFEPNDTDIQFLVQPLYKMHLFKADGSAAGIETVRIFIMVALLILGIACINYVNLSTARSMLRSREVSLRKIVGAGRKQLFMQFVMETALLYVLAAAVSIIVIYLLMPSFNRISGKELVFDPGDWHFWKVILITITSTLLASSIYPAILLSSFRPMEVLRGKISKSIGANAFRRILVVGQFTISVVLISSTLIIGKQLNYIRSKELGYDKSHVFSFHVPDINAHYDAMKAQLLREPGVISVTRSSDNIISLSNQTGNNSWDGKGPNQTFMLYPVAIDKDFIPFFKLQLVEGSNFSGAATDSIHVILNETAVREAGIQNPIGKRFKLHEHHATIIGVVKDFHFASLKKKIEPVVFYYDPAFSQEIHVRTRARDAAKAVAAARKVWEKDFAAYPFSYRFMDETFENMYKADQRTGTLFNVFALVAIVISCLGLFGLAAYTAQVRTREIGVRKVLGASVGQLVQLLARDFIRLVLLAILISVPPSWYLMNKWLEDFAYKIGISWTVFILSGMLAIGIALLTISFQSVKAALANPVKNLRTE